MNEIEAYKELTDILNGLQPYSIDLTLDRIKLFLKDYGNPQNSFKSIVVGGTNGKGSVCQFLTDVFVDAGIKTGTYTSPHLIDLNERFRINNIPVSYDMLLESAKHLKKSDSVGLTYFEFLTAMAFDIFKKNGVEAAILEVGMGGEFDAVNTVNPILSIITSISKDHIEHLGDTVKKIAKTKSKIIKNVGIIGKNSKEVIEIIKENIDAKLFFTDDIYIKKAKTIKTGMKGAASKENLATALLAVDILNDLYGFNLSYGVLERSFWPGRFEIIKAGDKTFIFDGAHNEGAAFKLAESLKNFTDSGLVMIFSTLKSKEWEKSLNLLIPYVQKIILAPIAQHRLAENTEKIKDFLQNKKEAVICKSVNDAVNLSLNLNVKNVVIAGSLYLIGEAKACKINSGFVP